MPVDRPKVPQVQRLEKIAAPADKTLDAMLDLGGDVTAESTADRQLAQGLPDIILQAVIGLGGSDVGEILLQGAYIRIDAHAIVVQNDEHVRIGNTRVVHGL